MFMHMTFTTALNLAVCLDNSARYYANKTALVYGDTRMTYAQVNGAACQIANAMVSKGLKAGDHIALSCLNLPYFPIIYNAILKIGATVVPLSIFLKKREIAYHLKDSDSVAYFCFVGTPELPMGQYGFDGFNEVESCKNFWLITPPGVESPIPGASTLNELMKDQSPKFDTVATDPNSTAVILYTSGTTGQPKGAELSHWNMYTNALTCITLVNADSSDIQLIALPLYHSFGQSVQMNSGILAGATLVLIARGSDMDAILSGFEKENVTLFAGVPTMYWGLLNHPNASNYDLAKIASNLRFCSSGGAAIPVEIMKGFEEKFKVQILEGYGLSETSPVATFSRMDLEKKPGSIGLPIKGVDLMVADQDGNKAPVDDIGEIWIRGPNVMKGYYKKQEATDKVFKNGWFATGDLGRMDEDGYFYIVDRIKDMIIRGGFNVYPREIEEVLMTHPAISLAAVVGEPDDKYGEEIKAYVVLKAGASATEQEIVEWSKQEMANYKYPRKVVIRTELPMGATGKILKRVLKEQ